MNGSCLQADRAHNGMKGDAAAQRCGTKVGRYQAKGSAGRTSLTTAGTSAFSP